jgi:endonuclease-3
MSRAASRLQKLISVLEAFYGRPAKPAVSDPLEMILWENVAYLADDARREAAWEIFRKRIGTTPEEILAAPRSELLAVAKAGILAADRVEKIREIASIALHEFGGHLGEALDASPTTAKKALKKFPGIGDPGAEKILLFSRRERVLALDSNGLRVLLRLGFGKEDRNYSTSYRSVQEATRAEWKTDFDWLIAAHQLLRRHGQELCKRTRPRCEACPLRGDCTYYRSLVRRRPTGPAE